MRIKPVVINLDRRSDRYSEFRHRVQLPHSRFSAFDGYDDMSGMWDHLLLEALRLNRNNSEQVMAGVYGCWRSHLAVWQELATQTVWDAYLILEDDVSVIPGFADTFQRVERNLTLDFDLVYLGGAIQREFVPRFIQENWEAVPQGDITVHRMHDRNWQGPDFGRGLYAYILTRGGAYKLTHMLINSILTGTGGLPAVDEWVNRNREPLSVGDVFPHPVWVENVGKLNDSDVNPIEAARQRAK